MKNTDKRVDNYIDSAKHFAQPILHHLRMLIHKTCPDVTETIKWQFPVFEYKGQMLCSFASFKEHCAFTFWKAALLEDKHQVLSKAGNSGMGHLGKITSLNDLPKESVLKDLLKQAMKLNEEGVKVPRPSSANKSNAELPVPVDFSDMLQCNKKALKHFDAFSPSHRKEYIMWFNEAKTQPTRIKRMETAIEWIAEGKGKNWKYEKPKAKA